MQSIGLQMINSWMRPYQRAWHRDLSRWRSYNKSRRIGVSTGCLALGAVLTSSGVYGDFVACDNYNLVSKVEVDAKDIIKHSRQWAHMLSRDPDLAPMMELSKDSATELEFKQYKKHIRSYTQSPGAVRSGNGHFGGDEVAFWPHAEAIWGGGVQSIQGNEKWRADFVSTPNGTSGEGKLHHDICRDPQFDYFSRHETNLLEAIDQGFPVDPDEIRRGCRTEEQYQQEYMCKFIGVAGEYFDQDFMLSCSQAARPHDEGRVFLGVDVASAIDLTAVVVLRLIHGVLWICEVYLMSQMPYASSPEGPGQDVVVASLIHHYKPEVCVMDATGEGSRLFAGVVRELGSTEAARCMVPHTVDNAWKVDIVPDLKGKMERGRVRIDAAQDCHQLNRSALERVAPPGLAVTPETAHVLVEEAFHRREWGHQLRADFQKVRKALTPKGQTTYDTGRDVDGHGDSFWASAMGYGACRHLIGDVIASDMASFWGDQETATFVPPEYTGYL